jgi:hypothetical protein
LLFWTRIVTNYINIHTQTEVCLELILNNVTLLCKK